MSGLDLLRDEDLRTEREKAREPAKRWRNWWRANIRQFSLVLDANGRETGEEQLREAGEEWCSVAIFQSKDEAERRALEIQLDAADEATAFDCAPLLTYLGAFSEGERPE